MPHTFQTGSFGHLAADAERLVEDASKHEEALAALAQRLEGHAELAASVDALRAGATEQRRIAEAIRAGLVGTAAGPDGNGAKRPLVLIVDDSEDNRDIAAMLIETSGFDTITAGNGLEGVIVAHYTHPALVIMDLAMPVLDGVQAARLLHASPATQDINVVAYTAKQILDEESLAPFADVLRKPASPDAILGVVQRLALPQEPEAV